MTDLTKALLGCALGDSLGLPYEALSHKKAKRLFKGKLRQSLFCGRGMLSDDTEHSALVILALQKSSSPQEFRKYMRSLLRRWLLTIPPGIGFGTLKAILKMWLGLKNTSTSSAGNGPLMRTAVLAVLKSDSADFEDYIRVNAELTHADNRVFESSLVYSRLIQQAGSGLTAANLENVKKLTACEEFLEILDSMIVSLNNNTPPQDFFESLGMTKGISGYCLHTFAGAVYPAIYFKGDFEKTLSCITEAGGDTDSVGAVAGSLCALMPGVELPQAHLSKLKDWPLSVKSLTRISEKGASICCLFPKMLLRNFFFVPLILLLAVLRFFR